MRKLRVAIVGCGRMGKVRAMASRKAGACIAFACDIDPALAADLGPERVCDHANALPWSEFDAVFVCTPPSARGPVERAAIGHGTPFFVEKPLGLSSALGEELLSSLDRRSVINAVGYMNRYRRSVERLRDIARLNQVLALSIYWVVGKYNKPWWADPNQSGGPVNEQATHLIDLVRYIAGGVSAPTVVAGRNEDPLLGSSWSASMRLENGAPCGLVYSCLAQEKSIALSLVTPKSVHTVEGWNFTFREVSGLEPDDPREREEVFMIETRAFLAAVRDQNPSTIRCDLADAIETQRVVDAINRQLADGCLRPHSAS